MKSISYSLLFILFSIISFSDGIQKLHAQTKSNPKNTIQKGILSWKSLPDLPNQTGIAGAFTGIQNGAFIFAGGANFPKKTSWKGGEKKFYSKVYVLQKNRDSYQWVTNSSLKLPHPLAYGAAVRGEKGLILIGGTDGNAVFDKVYRLRWHPDLQSVSLDTLPSLPQPLTFMSATRVGDAIYVAGGQHTMNHPKATKNFWRLDLSKQDQPEKFKWEKLPSWPGPPRVLPVTAGQHKGDRRYFFLFSGRNVRRDGSMSVLRDAYRFNPRKNSWKKLNNVGSNTTGGNGQSVMAGSALPMGDAQILVFGGDPGKYLMDRLHKMAKIGSLQHQKEITGKSSRKKEIQQKIDHFNEQLHTNLTQKAPYSNNILSYDTITDSWHKVGELPSPPPVTADMVKWNEKIILASGEIQPGVRTSKVWQGNISPKTPAFGFINYITLGAYGLILVAIGFYFSRRENATDDFFLADHRIPWWAAGISIYATQLSAITFISTPVLAFANNWIVYISYFTILLIAPVVIHFYLPFFRRLKVTTAYEYLEKRFNLAVRLFGSLSFILFQLGRMSIVVFLPALTLTAILNMNIYLAIVIMGVLAIIYTALGGIEAVIWSDVLQVVVLISGIIYSLFFIIHYVGGIDVIYKTAIANNKLEFVNFDFSFTSLATWSIFLGSFALQFGPYTTDQAVVQRYLTTNDEKSAANSIWTNGIISIPTGFLFFALGTCLYVFYKMNPDFLSPGMQNDQIFPLFISQQLPVGFSGLLIAGIFSASMSSLDSSMHSVATAITVDFYDRFVPQTNEETKLKLARWATVIIGSLGTLIACLLATLPIQSLYFFFQEVIGLLSSSLAGIFILGIFTQRTHGTGALIGAIISLIVLYAVKFHTPIHFYVYPLIGIPVCVISGYAISFLLPDHGKSLDNLTYRTLIEE